MSTVVAAIVIVLTVFLTLRRVAPLRKWLGYATILDIVFTVFMLWAFHDTYSGVVAAAFAGLFMALALTLMRMCMGYERLAFKRTKRWFTVEWRSYPPKAPAWFKMPKFPQFKIVRVA